MPAVCNCLIGLATMAISLIGAWTWMAKAALLKSKEAVNFHRRTQFGTLALNTGSPANIRTISPRLLPAGIRTSEAGLNGSGPTAGFGSIAAALTLRTWIGLQKSLTINIR